MFKEPGLEAAVLEGNMVISNPRASRASLTESFGYLCRSPSNSIGAIQFKTLDGRDQIIINLADQSILLSGKRAGFEASLIKNEVRDFG